MTDAALENDAVLHERLTLVATALEAPFRVGTFTDEELAALDDLTLSPIAPSPWFESLSDDEKQVALTAALRGLIARGVYRAEPVDPVARTYTEEIEPGIVALMTMRRYVPRLVVAERHTAEDRGWALVYPQRDEVFLTEYVDRRGLHEFVLSDAETTLAAMAAWCGALEDVPAPDLDVTLTPTEISEQPDVLAPVAASAQATTITRFEPDGRPIELQTTVFASTEGYYLAEPGDDQVRYSGLDRAGVRALWGSLLELA